LGRTCSKNWRFGLKDGRKETTSDTKIIRIKRIILKERDFGGIISDVIDLIHLAQDNN
jgi:hypothetical protein